jgi:hypothetical protein
MTAEKNVRTNRQDAKHAKGFQMPETKTLGDLGGEN